MLTGGAILCRYELVDSKAADIISLFVLCSLDPRNLASATTDVTRGSHFPFLRDQAPAECHSGTP
jgi:hypothetical protein